LDYFALGILIVLAAAAVGAAAFLGALPGRIAGRRSHPQADAIRVCGWLGLLTLGLLWPVAMIWAFLRPVAIVASTPEPTDRDVSAAADRERLTARIEALERELARLANQKVGPAS
jgi:hypothetical protein